MIGLILGIGIPLLYLFIGWRIAIFDMPRQWQMARRRYMPDSRYVRSDVMTIATWTALLWPFAGFLVLVSRSIDSRDPQRVKAELKATERRVAELERELGIGGN